MTRLILMRHAKSSWAEDTQTDHERPLNKRGRADAPRVARRLAELGWSPALALISDAARTEETWAWMQGEFAPEPVSHRIPSLYHGTIKEIREALVAHVTDEACVLVLGHNPGWEDAIQALAGKVERMTTANAALLMHPEPWPVAIQRSDWSVHAIVRPKTLP